MKGGGRGAVDHKAELGGGGGQIEGVTCVALVTLDGGLAIPIATSFRFQQRSAARSPNYYICL